MNVENPYRATTEVDAKPSRSINYVSLLIVLLLLVFFAAAFLYFLRVPPTRIPANTEVPGQLIVVDR